MQRIFERVKDGVSCGIWDEPRTKLQCTEEIISELCWGARTELFENKWVFTTKVFGDIDTTQFICDPDELVLVSGLIDAYQQGGRRKCLLHLLESMGIDGMGQNYRLEDVMVVYELYLDGATTAELLSIITPTELKGRKLAIPTINPDLIAMVNDLDPDDAIAKMLKPAIALKILDEAHHSK